MVFLIAAICIFENGNYTIISFESLRSGNNFMETCDAVWIDSLFLILVAVSLSGTATDFGQSGGFAQDGAIFQSGTLVLGIAIIHSNRF